MSSEIVTSVFVPTDSVASFSAYLTDISSANTGAEIVFTVSALNYGVSRFDYTLTTDTIQLAGDIEHKIKCGVEIHNGREDTCWINEGNY